MSSTRELPSSEYLQARRAIESLGATMTDVDGILAQIADLPSLRARFLDEYVALGPDGPITWVNHEHLAWALGESIRQTLQRRRSLRKDERLWDAIEDVATDRAVGKGREPFVMLLGQYGGVSRSSILVRLLDDPEVVGHAPYALRHLGVPDGRTKAESLLTHRRTWIRNEAKKYLKKLSPPPNTR